MNESMVTFQGWLGGDVRTRSAGGATVAFFRVGSTPRRFNRSSQTWVNGTTQWYTVNAWRVLGWAELALGFALLAFGAVTFVTALLDEPSGPEGEEAIGRGIMLFGGVVLGFLGLSLGGPGALRSAGVPHATNEMATRQPFARSCFSTADEHTTVVHARAMPPGPRCAKLSGSSLPCCARRPF